MQRFMDLLFGVWREACRHIEIAESTALIAPLVGEHLPVEMLLVRTVDVERSAVETVGLGVSAGVAPPESARTKCSPGELEHLLTWCRRGEILHIVAGASRDERHPYVPEGLDSEVLVGPLCSDSGPIGMLLLVARSGERFGEVHRELVKALLDPFRAALDNDRVLREMRTHRDAAEADRHSLLRRLGRQEISDAIVGAESGLRAVMERVQLVAHSDVPVLLFGETGSGKEVIARAIHTRSNRAAGPFLRVNCGAIPPELIDSELFGHERGSFTGAVGMRKGWFERADGGTLFLDEAGELPLAAQVRLLRILQDGTFERVGGQRQMKVDVRIVAATHRDLHQMVAQGRFREDLWYRIAVFPIHLPALRDRPEDMPALAVHFAQRAARRFGLPMLMPSHADIDLLNAYPWPGNIRELAAVIDRAAILGDGKRLEIAMAMGGHPVVARSPDGAGAAPLPAAAYAGPSSPPVATPSQASFLKLDEAMARHICAALERTAGRIEGRYGAARLLGINPHTLRARMRKLGVDWKQYRAMPEATE